MGVIITAGPVDPRDTIHFDQFFLEHHTRLVACGLALTNDRERARDAAQEAMARAFRDWQRVSTLDHPAAWVRRVLLNLLADEGRRDGRARRLRPVDDRHDDRPPSDSPLLAAIRRLPARQREAVVLHYLDDLPVEEVASAMKVAVGTVKATLHQARASLATILKEDPS